MTKQTKNLMSARRRCEFVVLVLGCLAFGYVFTSCSKPEKNTEIKPSEILPANTSEISVAPSINPNADFSKFDHKNAEHSRFPCALCHERTDNSATPKLVGHLPCSSCHTAQFADNQSKICTICHTNTESGIVKRFPALKSHNVVFDHAGHQRQTNCATCHKPSGEGMTILSGFNAHNACFQCHTPSAKSGEKNIGDCNVCHQDGNFARVSDSSTVYAATPFSHANHRLDCTNCHSVQAGTARGNQVTTLIAGKMHFPPKNAQSCASCHNNQKAFGGNDSHDCKRCHQGNDFNLSADSSTTPFRHLNHRLDCSICHTVRAGASGGDQVLTKPVAKMHFAPKNVQSCASCHNNKRTFGGDDFQDCRRCHQANSFRFR